MSTEFKITLFILLVFLFASSTFVLKIPQLSFISGCRKHGESVHLPVEKNPCCFGLQPKMLRFENKAHFNIEGEDFAPPEYVSAFSIGACLRPEESGVVQQN